MNITLEEIKEKIKEAEKLGACYTTIVVLENLNSLHDYLDHPDAPYWVYWMCAEKEERWEEAENIVLKCPQYSYYYAVDIIKDRWPEAGEIIATSTRWKLEYQEFLKEFHG